MSSTFSPHEVYSRCLHGAYGCPLWFPEPQDELPDDYRQEGLKIGDVGVVSPVDGCFDVLFNITLSRDKQPYPGLIQEDFKPVVLEGQADLTTKSDAVAPHSFISSGCVELVSQDIHDGDRKPLRADYEFGLSTEDDGAVLILPEGAQSCTLRNEQRFLDEAIKRGVDWYECATQRAGRLLNNDSLYLITGFHKTCSWSLAAAGRSRSSLQNRRSVKFKVGEVPQRGATTAEAYRWVPRAAHCFMPRVGPNYPSQHERDRCSVNQTVFIRGFRITVNKILFLKTVSIKTQQGTVSGFWTHLTSYLSGTTSQSTTEPDAGFTEPATEQDFSLNRGQLHMDSRMTVDRVPNILQTFHPGDLINQYMLKKEPHVMLAITHDELWIEMLRMELLELADFSHEERLQDVLSKYYRVMMKDDAVYLQREHALGSPHHEQSPAPDRIRSTSADRDTSRTAEASIGNKNESKTPSPSASTDIPDKPIPNLQTDTSLLMLIGVTNTGSLGILLPAVEIIQQMAEAYERIKFGRRRCKAIVQRAALIIREVRGSVGDDQGNITGLQAELEEIRTILQKLAEMSLLKALLRFGDINKEIERADRHLDYCLQLFSMDPSLHIQAKRKAEVSDQDTLRAYFKTVMGNYEEIRRRFGLDSDELEDQAMAAMQRELKNIRINSAENPPVEVQIMQEILECIKRATGKSPSEPRKWLITEYDLDYCGTIGSGRFSTVRKAWFRGTMVAVKTLKDMGNIKEVLESKIEIWSMLRHDHIVPFYGASTFMSQPIIVSSFMQNGNLLQYLAATPNADRRKLIFEVSLGMYYLHGENVVHGDLKGVNVLVDGSGEACITDFGLSTIIAAGAAGTKTSEIAGTLRFLAPEALTDAPLSFETDVYAFGMLIYEVFTEEVPFVHESDQVVLEARVELHRPTSTKVFERGFNDGLWQLLSDCISHEPLARPEFKTIRDHPSLVELSTESDHLDPTIGTEVEDFTDGGLDAEQTAYPSFTLFDRMVPPLDKGRSVQTRSHGGSVYSGPTLANESENMTDLEFDVKSMASLPRTLIDSTAPLPGKSKPAWMEHPSVLSTESVQRDPTRFPILPMCILVTNKHFDVPFGVSSREPGVYLETTNTFQWQPVKAKKGSLLGEEGNRFRYKSGVGNGTNTWELDGNDVTVRTALHTAVCHFRDARTAEKWFRLQLNYSRNGSVGNWVRAMGDLFHTERSWRRLLRGKIQQADVVVGAPTTVPTDLSWSDVNLPKRYIIDNFAGSEDCIVCITNPGKRPGRFCCKLEESMIVFETYRLPGDKRPSTTREETYPSKEYAQMTFGVLKAVLEKGTEKNIRSNLFTF